MQGQRHGVDIVWILESTCFILQQVLWTQYEWYCNMKL